MVSLLTKEPTKILERKKSKSVNCINFSEALGSFRGLTRGMQLVCAQHSRLGVTAKA